MTGQRTRGGGKRGDRTSPRAEASSRPPGVTLTALGLSLPKSFFIESDGRTGGRVWRGSWCTMNRCRGCVSELVRPHVAGGVGTSAQTLSMKRRRLPPRAMAPTALTPSSSHPLAKRRQRHRSPLFPISGARVWAPPLPNRAKQHSGSASSPRPPAQPQTT